MKAECSHSNPFDSSSLLYYQLIKLLLQVQRSWLCDKGVNVAIANFSLAHLLSWKQQQKEEKEKLVCKCLKEWPK